MNAEPDVMYKLFLVTFAVLAWAFYALSGGSEFTPPPTLEESAPVLATFDLPEQPVEEPADEATPITAQVENDPNTGDAVTISNPATETPTLDLRRVSGSRVNMRSGPSTNDRVVTTLSQGTQVEVLGENAEGWAELRVIETNQRGWMAARFLATE